MALNYQVGVSIGFGSRGVAVRCASATHVVFVCVCLFAAVVKVKLSIDNSRLATGSRSLCSCVGYTIFNTLAANTERWVCSVLKFEDHTQHDAATKSPRRKSRGSAFISLQAQARSNHTSCLNYSPLSFRKRERSVCTSFGRRDTCLLRGPESCDRFAQNTVCARRRRRIRNFTRFALTSVVSCVLWRSLFS